MEALLYRIQQRSDVKGFSPQIEYWLQDVKLTADDQGNLTLLCPNTFSMRWLKEKYKAPLSRALQEETGKPVLLHFRLRENPPPPSPLDCDARGDGQQVPHTLQSVPSPCPYERGTEYPDHPEGAFESSPHQNPHTNFCLTRFVVGPSNRFAWTAAQEICKGFQPYYNPFFLLAGTGLGKTHLGQGIAHQLQKIHGGTRVLYRTVERFFSEMIDHMKTRSIHLFKDRYRRSCDALILDDFQFVMGKKALQSELCYTFDTLLNQGKQVVLLGNLPSRDSEELSESLRSRIFSGLSVSIEPPDYVTRLAILQGLAAKSNILFPLSCLEKLAGLVRSNVRELEGAFNHLVAVHRLLRHPLDPDSVETLLQEQRFGTPGSIPLVRILDHVARYFGLQSEELTSRSRHRKVLYPRQVCMYLCRKHTNASLQSIGTLFQRDHSSVLYAVQSLKKKFDTNPRYQREVLFIEEKLLQVS
jgi:chromosomal replication initiator protein